MRDYIVVYELPNELGLPEEHVTVFAAYSYTDAAGECFLAYPGAFVLSVQLV